MLLYQFCFCFFFVFTFNLLNFIVKCWYKEKNMYIYLLFVSQVNEKDGNVVVSLKWVSCCCCCCVFGYNVNLILRDI